MLRFTCLILSLAVLAFGVTPAAAIVVQVEPIVLEGYNVAGVGTISTGFSASEAFSVNNNGEWIVETATNHADANSNLIVARGTGFHASLPPPSLSIFQRENQALPSPAGTNISSFDDHDINNLGGVAQNIFLRNATTSTDSGIFVNGSTLVIQESNISTAPQFSAGTPYIGWFGAKINDNNNIIQMASVDDPGIASSVDRALVRVNPGSGAQHVYMKEGDSVLGFALADFDTDPFAWEWNNNDEAIFSVDSTDPTAATDGAIMKHDGSVATLLAREGSPSAVVGRNWGTLLGAAVDMNDSGDWVMRGDLDGASTTDDSVIVKNGSTVIAREGSSLPAIGGVFTFSSFGSGSVGIAANGKVIWHGDWNDPDTFKDDGIFLDDQILVQEGVTLINGVLLQSISEVTDNFAVSDNGEWLVFEGTLANGLDGAFLVHVPEPTTLLLLAAGGAFIRRRRA